MEIEIRSTEQILGELQNRALFPWEGTYHAHFSTYWQGIVTDPRLLLLPVDDHMVHRGDGVFEALRLIENNIYLLSPHLQRLRRSAKMISLDIPWSDEEIEAILRKLSEVSGPPNLMFRLFVSRGRGGFTTNPYECPQSHLIIVACGFKPLPPEKYHQGVRIGRSQIRQKPEPFASIKSCNYLPNVLMKKEAVDRNLDFVIAYNERSELTESSTENILIYSKDGKLLHPRFETILRGTTLARSLELAKTHLGTEVQERTLYEKDLLEAQEVFMIGTTLDVLPVRQYEQTSFSMGPMGQSLIRLLKSDQLAPKN